MITKNEVVNQVIGDNGGSNNDSSSNQTRSFKQMDNLGGTIYWLNECKPN